MRKETKWSKKSYRNYNHSKSELHSKKNAYINHSNLIFKFLCMHEKNSNSQHTTNIHMQQM